MLKKYLITIFFLSITFLKACQICVLEVPKVDVNTKIEINDDNTFFQMTWQFHKDFTRNLILYDYNENNTFDEEEILDISDAIIVYAEPLNYLTFIEIVNSDKEFLGISEKELQNIESKTYFDIDNALVFKYSFTLNKKITRKDKLSLLLYDDRGSFDFRLKDILITGAEKFALSKINVGKSIIDFSKEGFDLQTIEPKDLDVVELKDLKEINENQISILEVLSKALNDLKLKISDKLVEIKDYNSASAYVWLLLFSFVYGVIHAIGPGHGKTLVASYFLNENRSYIKAFSIASLIGVTHTFSAFVLTIGIFFFLGLIFSSTLIELESLATKVSALIIIFIALFLIYKKIKVKKPAVTFLINPAMQINQNNQNFVQTPFSVAPNQIHKNELSCGCNSCKTTGTDLGVILAAGIVPCPGTVTIFIFTLSLGIYFVGFLSAVFMSMGMSFIIFLTALLSIKVRKKSSTNAKLLKLFEYGSLFIILILGMLLFFL